MEQEGMGDIDLGNFIARLKFVKYIVNVKREIGPNNGFPEAFLLWEQINPLKLSKNWTDFFNKLWIQSKSHHTNVNKYWSACRRCCQNVYRITWMPPSLLQFSMYFVTSCDSNPLAPEGNRPIWPPIWGPDGWLSLLPILSSFVKQDPSRQLGDTTSSSRNTQYYCPQLSHQTSLRVVTKPEDHSLLRKERRNALTMPEECFFQTVSLCLRFRFTVINSHVWPAYTPVCLRSNELNDRVTLL